MDNRASEHASDELAQPSKKVKLTKRERRQGDPAVRGNIAQLLEMATSSVLDAHRLRGINRFQWPSIRTSQQYVREAVALAQKCVVRMPRAQKHSFCGLCHVPSIPGITSALRVQRHDGIKYAETACTLCRHTRKLVLRVGLQGTSPSSRRPRSKGCRRSARNQSNQRIAGSQPVDQS